MKAPKVRSLSIAADLTETSLEEALGIIDLPKKKFSLVVEASDAYEAGELTEKFGLSRATVIPDGFFDWGSWMLKDEYGTVWFANKGA